jgi:uncharacterized protein (TIGR00255 family)
MLLSMTGYGRGTTTYHDKTIVTEIRSLNSKFADLRMKVPQNYREKEHEIRRMISERLERGKIDFSIDIQSVAGEEGFSLNKPLFRKYHQELSRLASELSLNEGDLMQSILRLPNVVGSNSDVLNNEEWMVVQKTIEEAVKNFDAFRLVEGASIESDMRMRIGIIQDNLEKIKPFEDERVVKLRHRLFQNLEEYLGKEKIDENRFEQEIIYYLEKMDITEEKVRLSQHCLFFLEELDQKHTQKGRKLSFISQEIGREINTLGAKAYSPDIQRLVVAMKDELEKIKEQVANSL